MNATTPPLNPINSTSSPSTAGKQQTAAAPDVPFNQVLAGEIAQNKRSAKAREDSRTDAGTEAEATPVESGKADTVAVTETPETAACKYDPLVPPGLENPSLAQNLPGMPDAIQALAMQLQLLKPASAVTDSARGENTSAVGADAMSFLDIRKDTARAAWRFVPGSDETAGTPKPDANLTAKAEFQAAMANPSTHAAAAAVAGQLAAARQSDAIKLSERLPDIINSPTLAATSQALLDTPATFNSIGTNTLAPSVGTTAWNQALGDRIVWMATGAQQTASLTLNPPNLGPLQIVLNLTNDQATASFFTAQPEVRQALEAAFPKLREMMSEAGIQLGQATVSADTSRHNDTPERQAQRIATSFNGTDEAAASPATPLPVRQSGRGLVDTFA